MFQLAREQAKFTSDMAEIAQSARKPPRRVQLAEEGSITMSKLWVYDYVKDGILWPSHLAPSSLEQKVDRLQSSLSFFPVALFLDWRQRFQRKSTSAPPATSGIRHGLLRLNQKAEINKRLDPHAI